MSNEFQGAEIIRDWGLWIRPCQNGCFRVCVNTCGAIRWVSVDSFSTSFSPCGCHLVDVSQQISVGMSEPLWEAFWLLFNLASGKASCFPGNIKRLHLPIVLWRTKHNPFHHSAERVASVFPLTCTNALFNKK